MISHVGITTMTTTHRIAATLLGLGLAFGTAHAAAPTSPESEGALRQELQQAVWPADIVRLADQYLSRFPAGNWAGDASTLRERAGMTAVVLKRNDVRLYRSAFQSSAEDSGVREDLRRAALGDAAAAVRLARLYQNGEGGLPQDSNRYVGWLQYASMLGDDRASYELALHFRRESQPVLAAKYEARAIELGFVPPRTLDHFRK
jgi:TPR repeat protein